MAIELERVLELSLKEYCKKKGRSTEDYRVVLLSYPLQRNSPIFSDKEYFLPDTRKNPKKEIAKKAPEGTEVIVSFKIESYASHSLEAYGLALIPK